MSDNDTGPKNGGIAKGTAQGWSDHELLVYLISAMEHSNWAPDFNNAPIPVGRNANGIRQKLTKVKHSLRPELDALKAGQPLAVTSEATPKKTATPRKRKVKDEGETEATPTKRGRKKKSEVKVEDEADEDVKADTPVQGEAEDDDEV
ncbi:hypothetical protein ACN47E_008621 [Coniothyrium glycines]